MTLSDIFRFLALNGDRIQGAKDLLLPPSASAARALLDEPRADRVRIESDSGDKTAVGTLAADEEDPRLMELYGDAAGFSAIFRGKGVSRGAARSVTG